MGRLLLSGKRKKKHILEYVTLRADKWKITAAEDHIGLHGCKPKTEI